MDLSWSPSLGSRRLAAAGIREWISLKCKRERKEYKIWNDAELVSQKSSLSKTFLSDLTFFGGEKNNYGMVERFVWVKRDGFVAKFEVNHWAFSVPVPHQFVQVHLTVFKGKKRTSQQIFVVCYSIIQSRTHADVLVFITRAVWNYLGQF